MKRDDDARMWIVGGAVGATAIGIALIPFREWTSASNLAFVFLAFTIILAELGGRAAAVVTAVMSAINLNFFLTKPYLTLNIEKRDDIIAFAALLAIGLIAAAFGKRRKIASDAANRAVKEMAVIKGLLEQLKTGTPLNTVLNQLKTTFNLGTIVLRKADEAIVAAAPAQAKPDIPKIQLGRESLFPAGETVYRLGAKGFRLPEGGGRLILKTEGGDPFFLDLWEGDPEGLNPDESRTLAVAALLLAQALPSRA